MKEYIYLFLFLIGLLTMIINISDITSLHTFWGQYQHRVGEVVMKRLAQPTNALKLRWPCYEK